MIIILLLLVYVADAITSVQHDAIDADIAAAVIIIADIIALLFFIAI